MSRWFCICCLWAALLISVACASVWAQSPRVTVSTDILPTDCETPMYLVDIYIDHPLDSLAGFEIYFKIDSGVPARFQLLDEGQLAYDLTGGGFGLFEYFTINTLHGDGTDLEIVGLAEGNFVPPFRRGIGPGLHRVATVGLRILGGADTLPNPVGVIQIDKTPAHLGFATPEGQAIGITNGQFDTNLVKFSMAAIETWGGQCAAGSDIDNNGTTLTLADLIALRDVIQGKAPIPDHPSQGDFNGDCTIDSADVHMFERYFQQGLGALMPWPRSTCCYQTVVPCYSGKVGNIDCDPADGVDIVDLTAMVQNLFITISDPCCFGEADLDRNGGIDISDLTLLVDALFISLTPLPNCPLIGAGPLRAVSCGQ